MLRVANKGDEFAQRELGNYYYYGVGGVQQNRGEAAEWYRKAANQGDTFSQFALAKMYRDGEGVPLDYALAYKWFNLAAANYDALDYNKSWRDELAAKMTPEQIAEAQRLAQVWKPTK
jgi:TPR repeat protein